MQYEKEKKVLELLQNAKNVFIYAGAGMSADLGIKTYWSGADSLYGSDVSKYGFTTLEHANASMWREHYNEQKQYSLDRLEDSHRKLSESSDNIYTSLLKFLQNGNKSYTVATSNTDNAFLHYGYEANALYEVHGNQNWLQCTSEKHGVFIVNRAYKCPICESSARSNTLMFDDFRFELEREKKQAHSFFDQIYEMCERVDDGETGIVLEIGVGDTVSKIRNMARKASLELNIPYVHVNLAEPSEVEAIWQKYKEVWLPMRAAEFAEILPLKQK